MFYFIFVEKRIDYCLVFGGKGNGSLVKPFLFYKFWALIILIINFKGFGFGCKCFKTRGSRV